AANSIVPSKQCLKPDHLTADLGLRLVEKLKFVTGDSATQLLLNGASLAQPIVHFNFEEAGRSPTGALGSVERGIGIVKERCCIAAVVRKDRDPDADADAQTLTIEVQISR